MDGYYTAPKRTYPPGMPLTPGDTDTDNEERKGALQLAGRKRSAGEMEDEGEQAPMPPASDLRQDPESLETKPDPDGTDAVESEPEPEEEPEEEPSFVVECPAPSVAVVRDRLTRDGVYIQDVEHPLEPSLRVTYAVRPGEKWSATQIFLHAKCKSIEDATTNDVSNMDTSLRSRRTDTCDLFDGSDRLCQST